MPETTVVFYAEDDGAALLLTWLDQQQRKVQDKCLVKIERLAELGMNSVARKQVLCAMVSTSQGGVTGESTIGCCTSSTKGALCFHMD